MDCVDASLVCAQAHRDAASRARRMCISAGKTLNSRRCQALAQHRARLRPRAWRTRRSSRGAAFARFAVHGLDQRGDILRRRRRHDAVPEIEDVSGRRARGRARRPRPRARPSPDRSAAPADRDCPAARRARRRGGARRARSTVQSSPTHDAPHAAMSSSHCAAALGEHDRRHAASVAAPARARPARRASTRARMRGTRRADSSPPQVSKIITASAPAAICSLR